METLWETLNQVITRGVTWDDNMELPVWLYALIGYTDRRIRKYKYQGITFKQEQKFEEVFVNKPVFRSIKFEFWGGADRETGGMIKAVAL